MGEVVHYRSGQPPERITVPTLETPPVDPEPHPPPAPEPAPVPPEPAAEPPAEEPPPSEGETPEDEETVTVPEHQRRRPRRPDAEARIREVVAVNQALTRERDDARAAQAMLERLLREQQQSRPAEPPASAAPPAPALPPRPREHEFDTVAAYEQALDEWMDARITARAEQQVQTRWEARERQLAETRMQTLVTQLGQRIAEARQLYPDFDLAYNSPQNTYRDDLQSIVIEHVTQHPQGHLVLYHLATHPEAREELHDRTPAGARRFLTTLTQQLAHAPAAEPAPVRQPRAAPSTATATPVLPPPVGPITNGATPGRMDARHIAENKGSLLLYMRRREEEERQQG